MTPKWVPKSLRKTVGGQPVGYAKLKCEPFGGSDYCRHCSRDMMYYEGRDPTCQVLEKLRLGMIPDAEVSAFGCDKEAAGYDCCEKWCHGLECAFALKEVAA